MGEPRGTVRVRIKVRVRVRGLLSGEGGGFFLGTLLAVNHRIFITFVYNTVNKIGPVNLKPGK